MFCCLFYFCYGLVFFLGSFYSWLIGVVRHVDGSGGTGEHAGTFDNTFCSLGITATTSASTTNSNTNTNTTIDNDNKDHKEIVKMIMWIIIIK